ncbi:MAG: methyltransferase domain-containing protein [Vicingaceae bacterium]
MPDFSQRSKQEELLDQEHLHRQELFRNLEELDTINRLLGGHKASLKGLKQLLTKPDVEYHIVDFACGGGDTLRAIADWGKAKGYHLKLSGFDLLGEAIEFAKEKSQDYEIEFKQADFKDFQAKEPIDIACCALVCHHFYGKELEHFLKRMKELARLGVIINDLHRHPFAYYSIQQLTKFFSRSTYVKNDAPLSVLKGFKKAEWEDLLKSAGYENFQVEWIWAFRHLIVEKQQHEKI